MNDGFGNDFENLPEGLEDVQRWAALAGGGWLIARGLFKRSITGIGMMFVGGLLLDRGLTGRWSTARDLETVRRRDGGADGAPRTPQRAGERGAELAEAAEKYDQIDESSAESFPASDSPSWTPDTRIGEPPRRQA